MKIKTITRPIVLALMVVGMFISPALSAEPIKIANIEALSGPFEQF